MLTQFSAKSHGWSAFSHWRALISVHPPFWINMDNANYHMVADNSHCKPTRYSITLVIFRWFAKFCSDSIDSPKYGHVSTIVSYCIPLDIPFIIRTNQKSIYIYTHCTHSTSSTAQGGGGSFFPIGEVGCCESRMAERSHWLTETWLELCLLEWLQWLQWSPHPQLLDVVWCTAAVVVV